MKIKENIVQSFNVAPTCAILLHKPIYCAIILSALHSNWWNETDTSSSMPFPGLFYSTVFQIPVTEIQIHPAEIEFPPAEIEFPPREFQFPPTEFQFPPSEFQFPPTEMEFPPTEMEFPPSEFQVNQFANEIPQNEI